MECDSPQRRSISASIQGSSKVTHGKEKLQIVNYGLVRGAVVKRPCAWDYFFYCQTQAASTVHPGNKPQTKLAFL